jgi:mono/diheme cytochrome c family protein
MNRTMIRTLGTTSAALLMAAGAAGWAADEMAPAHSDRAGLMATPITATDGGTLYQSVCQACHMPGAVGATAAGYYPPLARDPRLASKNFPLLRVLNGSKGMPSFAASMSDAQIAAVVAYVRTHFGNAFRDPVTAADVKVLRKK